MTFTNIKKLITPVFVGVASAAVYTAPATAGNQTQVTRIKLHNIGLTDVPVKLFDNSATLKEEYSVLVNAGDTIEVCDEWQLNAGEAIYAIAGTANAVYIFISGREYA